MCETFCPQVSFYTSVVQNKNTAHKVVEKWRNDMTSSHVNTSAAVRWGNCLPARLCASECYLVQRTHLKKRKQANITFKPTQTQLKMEALKDQC